MSADLIAIAVLACFGLLWMFVNIKSNHASSLKTVSLWLMWWFLLAATLGAMRFSWGALS